MEMENAVIDIENTVASMSDEQRKLLPESSGAVEKVKFIQSLIDLYQKAGEEHAAHQARDEVEEGTTIDGIVEVE